MCYSKEVCSKAHWLNVNQSPDALAKVYQGDENYYYRYLQSQPYQLRVLRYIGAFVTGIGGPVLDVGCGEGCLSQWVSVPYVGIDGSKTAIERGLKRRGLGRQFLNIRMEDVDNLPNKSVFDSIVFSGILEVLIKPEYRVEMLHYYAERYGASFIVVQDLQRLDEQPLAKTFHLVIRIAVHIPKEELPEVVDAKRHRKILFLKVRK